MHRKEFLSKALIGGSVLFIAPAAFNSCSKASDTNPDNGGNTTAGTVIDLNSASFDALKTVGGSAYSGNYIIIRTSTSNYTVLSKICTHEGCTVAFNSSANKLVCPCHGAAFNTSGTVLQGPANSPLKVYSTTVEGTNLKIS